jgi:hypothetical protein
MVEELLQKKYSLWSLHIESIEHAHRVIRDTAWGFVGVGIAMIAISFFVEELADSFLDGTLYILFGSLVGNTKKRWLSIVLILLTFASLFFTAQNFLSGFGGGNIFLAVILVYASVQSLLATSFLQKHHALNTENPGGKGRWNILSRQLLIILSWVSVIVLIGFVSLILLGLSVPVENTLMLPEDTLELEIPLNPAA